MTGKAIAEFFEPLRVWLEAENVKNKVHIGWTTSDSKSFFKSKSNVNYFVNLSSFAECVSS